MFEKELFAIAKGVVQDELSEPDAKHKYMTYIFYTDIYPRRKYLNVRYRKRSLLNGLTKYLFNSPKVKPIE